MHLSKNLAIGFIFLVFFVISFLTNILGPLVPDIIGGFKVSMAMAAVLPFSFFIAYGVMSIPAGFLIERWGEKRSMLAALCVAFLGALAFAASPTYAVAVASLFVTGAGMAALQVALNPLLRVVGGEEHFAFNSAFAQFVFGVASFLSPKVYEYLIAHLGAPAGGQSLGLQWIARLTPSELPWVSIYWLFALIALLTTLLLSCIKLPKVKRTSDESAGDRAAYGKLVRNPTVWAYFLCVVAYVGSEQGTADWMSEFLSRYHGADPHTTGADAIAYFWGMLTLGCLLGMALLRLYDSRRVLIATCAGALLMLSLALFAPYGVALWAFPAVGFFASIMWPTIVSLALNSVSHLHGPFAGILCTGISGGALVPLLIGRLADSFGLRQGLFLLYGTFGIVLSIGFWARPIINNAVRERHAALAA